MIDRVHTIYHHLIAAEAALLTALDAHQSGQDPNRSLGRSLEETARAQSRLADLLRNPPSPGLAGVATPSTAPSAPTERPTTP